MDDLNRKKRTALRKLITIPGSIIEELKGLSTKEDKTLKSFIQDVLTDLVEKHRNSSTKN